jgi:uncharacterized protein (TIGR03118 family)
MPSLSSRMLTLAACCGMALMWSGAGVAQSFTAVSLVSNLSGKGAHIDPLLANPWGLAYAPGGAFWISDAASGYSTLYDGSGNPEPLQVIVPPSSGTGVGSPTGIVFNGSTEFAIDTWTSVFIFSTLDGTIQGWSGFDPSTSLIAVQAPGAVYTGLAITSYTSGNHIYAADSANNKVDMYDGNFNLVSSFTDPATPRGFAPFGIQDISGQVYVAYAAQSGGTGGFVDIFGEDGTYLKRLVQGSKVLNQPWGMAVAPTGWGAKFGGALLVTNNSSLGNINAFNLTTGALIDTLKDPKGRVIGVNGMWGIEFGGGTAANGKTSQLFFTAGPNDADGYFGVINVVK